MSQESTPTTSSTDLTGQSYIFDFFYSNINEIIKSYKTGTYLQKFKTYFTASDGNFNYYFRTIALSYYNILFHGSTLTLDSDCVKNMANKFDTFRREIINEPKSQWYKMSHSILGSMSSIGFTNIYTAKNWRNKLESVGAGYNSTEKQCDLTIGSMINASEGQSQCNFCKVKFTHATGGCLISCEHLLEIGLLTFLTGLTPNMKYLNKEQVKEIKDYFNSMGCYMWACQRCNMLKSNVQSKKYKNNECSIFIKFDETYGFQPNDLALEEFCKRVLDLNRGSYYIVKCSEIKTHIMSIHNPHNSTLNYFPILLEHMKVNVVGKLVIHLNQILEDYYGKTKSEQLSSMFAAGIIRYAILDLKLIPDLKDLLKSGQYGGNKYDTLLTNNALQSEVDGTLEELEEKPEFENPEKVLLINKQALINFLKIFEISEFNEESFIRKSNLLLFNIENFIYSINIFFDYMYETFETIYGLKDDIINLEYARYENPDLSTSIAPIYDIDTKNIQDFTLQIISFLCTLNNFEIVYQALDMLLKQNINGFTQKFIIYLSYNFINYEQIIQNLIDDYLQSMGNIVKTSYRINSIKNGTAVGEILVSYGLNDYCYLNKDGTAVESILTAYGLNDYCYLIHEEYIILCKILEYDGNESDLSENEKMFGTYDVRVIVIYSINSINLQVIPPNTQLILETNNTGKASPDINVTLQKFCKDNVITTVGSSTDGTNITFSFYGGNNKKSKKIKKSKKNQKIKKKQIYKTLNSLKIINFEYF